MVLITQITPPNDGVMYTSPNNVKLKLGDKMVGTGTLYITQSNLSWQPNDMQEGISILWKQVSVHGISPNPSKCIYFMLDHGVEWEGVYDGKAAIAANGHNGGAAEPMDDQAANDTDEDEGNESENDEDVLEEGEQMTECWLIPEDVHAVDSMFRAMTDCQALHPDSAESISEESDFMDDGGDDGEMDDDIGPRRDDNGLTSAAQDGMQNLNINDDERFADADE